MFDHGGMIDHRQSAANRLAAKARWTAIRCELCGAATSAKVLAHEGPLAARWRRVGPAVNRPANRKAGPYFWAACLHLESWENGG